MSELFRFLQLSDDAKISVDRRVNVSGLPKSRMLQNALQGSVALKKIIGLFVPIKPRRKIRAMLEVANTKGQVVMPQEVRTRFDTLFEADLEYVEQILGRNMTYWRALHKANS